MFCRLCHGAMHARRGEGERERERALFLNAVYDCRGMVATKGFKYLEVKVEEGHFAPDAR